MPFDLDVAMSVLKLTRDGSVRQESLKNSLHCPDSAMKKSLAKMQNNGLIEVHGEELRVDSFQRLQLAMYAIGMGGDVQRTSRCLQWREFEQMTCIALERNGYAVRRNVRFTQGRNKNEIDVVGCKKPLVVCVDCKHWKHGLSKSALEGIVKKQVERTRTLREMPPSLRFKPEWEEWSNSKFIPAVVSLTSDQFKFIDDVPIVPVLQLQDFILHLSTQTDSLLYFDSRHSRKKDSNQLKLDDEILL